MTDSSESIEKAGTAGPAAPAAARVLRRLEASAGGPVFPFDGPRARAGEQYRIIRTKIVHHPRRPRMLTVSSAGAGDGKTITCINLAAALALKRDSRVLLADADFRRPSVAETLGLPQEPGFADVLAGTRELDQALIRIDQIPGLHVLTTGAVCPNPAELLDCEQWSTLCQDLRNRFDYIVVDAPPIAAVADYELIQAACDAVVVVIRVDHSRRAASLEAIESVPKEKLVGVVLNDVRDWFLWKRNDSYYYDYARRPA